MMRIEYLFAEQSYTEAGARVILVGGTAASSVAEEISPDIWVRPVHGRANQPEMESVNDLETRLIKSGSKFHFIILIERKEERGVGGERRGRVRAPSLESSSSSPFER